MCKHVVQTCVVWWINNNNNNNNIGPIEDVLEDLWGICSAYNILYIYIYVLCPEVDVGRNLLWTVEV